MSTESLFAIDADGWMTGVTRIESPNADERPPGIEVELIVVHAISLPPGHFGGGHVEALFTNTLDVAAHDYFSGIQHLRVSAHLYVRRNGDVIQFVSLWRRAWHAGVSCWQGRERCNDYSIGIELEGCDEAPFDDRQYATLSRLIERIRERCPTVVVTGHSDIAPGRKTDPGPCFDWTRVTPL